MQVSAILEVVALVAVAHEAVAVLEVVVLAEVVQMVVLLLEAAIVLAVATQVLDGSLGTGMSILIMFGVGAFLLFISSNI